MRYRKLSVVIPVYNESATIEDIINSVLDAPSFGLEKEIIVVDDGSTDGTQKILQKHGYFPVKFIFKEKNEGKGSAVRTGFRIATGDITIVQDADLEYHPRDFEKLLLPFFADNTEVVYGSRFLKKGGAWNLGHSFLNICFTKLSNLSTGQKLTDIMTGYKALGREALDKIKDHLETDHFGIEIELTIKLSRLGYGIYEVPIGYMPRTKKEGKHMDFKEQIKVIWTWMRYTLTSRS